jgi:hypothetical protein
MPKSSSSISKSRSYSEIGEYWDEHDLGEVWDETRPVDIDVDLQSEKRYYPIARRLSEELNQMAKAQGISPETLINLWVQEKTAKKASG